MSAVLAAPHSHAAEFYSQHSRYHQNPIAPLLARTLIALCACVRAGGRAGDNRGGCAHAALPASRQAARCCRRPGARHHHPSFPRVAAERRNASPGTRAWLPGARNHLEPCYPASCLLRSPFRPPPLPRFPPSCKLPVAVLHWSQPRAGCCIASPGVLQPRHVMPDRWSPRGPPLGPASAPWNR